MFLERGVSSPQERSSALRSAPFKPESFRGQPAICNLNPELLHCEEQLRLR
jgi:hypothetical protein